MAQCVSYIILNCIHFQIYCYSIIEFLLSWKIKLLIFFNLQLNLNYIILSLLLLYMHTIYAYCHYAYMSYSTVYTIVYHIIYTRTEPYLGCPLYEFLYILFSIKGEVELQNYSHKSVCIINYIVFFQICQNSFNLNLCNINHNSTLIIFLIQNTL